MKIMGHRGAAGLAMENTEKSIKIAISLGVDAIELDIRKTKDNQLVLCHDDSLMRTASNPAKVKDLTKKEFCKITLHDGSNPISLRDALIAANSTPLMIDLKDGGCARILLDLLKEFPKTRASVASFNLSELALLRQMDENIELFGLESTKPFDILHFAKVFRLNGIGLNYWIMNPLTYFRAKQKKIKMYVYTVNHGYTFWFIRIFFPGITVCTNYPDRYTTRKFKQARAKE